MGRRDDGDENIAHAPSPSSRKNRKDDDGVFTRLLCVIRVLINHYLLYSANGFFYFSLSHSLSFSLSLSLALSTRKQIMRFTVVLLTDRFRVHQKFPPRARYTTTYYYYYYLLRNNNNNNTIRPNETTSGRFSRLLLLSVVQSVSSSRNYIVSRDYSHGYTN